MTDASQSDKSEQDQEPMKVLLVDDLLATGGTAAAASELVARAGGQLVGCSFVIELAGLEGRQQLPQGVSVDSLVVYS